MGTVRWKVRSSTACAKPGGQLTQHLPCCLCAHSTMSISPATEYSLRQQTTIITIWKSSFQPGPWNSYRHPWSWSWSLSLSLPTNISRMREDVGVSNYHMYHVIGLFYRCCLCFKIWMLICLTSLGPIRVTLLGWMKIIMHYSQMYLPKPLSCNMTLMLAIVFQLSSMLTVWTPQKELKCRKRPSIYKNRDLLFLVTAPGALWVCWCQSLMGHHTLVLIWGK